MTGTKLAVTLGAAALLLAACSSPGTSGTTTHPAATQAAAAQPPAAPPSSAPAAATSALDGIWHGQYGGSYQGTFILHWRQAGSALTGHIRISNPGSSMPLPGPSCGPSPLAATSSPPPWWPTGWSTSAPTAAACTL